MDEKTKAEYKRINEARSRNRFICEKPDAQGYGIEGTGCGEIPAVEFDAYSFMDRQGEGVMITAHLENGEYVTTMKDMSGIEYLDESKILKDAQSFISSYDIASCPTCKGDVVLPE